MVLLYHFEYWTILITANYYFPALLTFFLSFCAYEELRKVMISGGEMFAKEA
jgi:hypothetical protein